MRRLNRSFLSASMMLGAAMASAGFSAAFAQGTDSVPAEEPAEIIEEAEPCAEGEDCADAPVEAEEVFADDAWMAAPAPEAVPDAEPAAAAPVAQEQTETQGGAVLAVPGSTDESDPGGSTRPGTRPDD
jgi:hypothetical protein